MNQEPFEINHREIQTDDNVARYCINRLCSLKDIGGTISTMISSGGIGGDVDWGIHKSDEHCKEDYGIEEFDGVYFIDSNLGKITSRSTVGTYVGLLPLVRKVFSNTKEAKVAGYMDGHFSWNSPLGQCAGCEGTGTKLIDLHFLEDLEFVCDICEGRKIKRGPLK